MNDTDRERGLRNAISGQTEFMAQRGGTMHGYIRFYEGAFNAEDRDDDQRRIVDVWEADRAILRKYWGALNTLLARLQERRSPAQRRMR